MAIRILHTADNHIGLKFANYPKGVRDRLIAERFAALEKVVASANERECHFLVVAGDLFDSVNVKQGDIKEVVSVLKKFSGQSVLVLPGNHDYFTSLQHDPWKKFIELSSGTHIELLFDNQPRSYEVAGEEVVFYPCPCPGKYGEESLVPWVTNASKNSEALNIGIAHGNVEGLGMDEEGRYFNMTVDELKNSGMDFWLLGHIHVAYPSPSFSGNPVYFMPATHTPDSIKRDHPGYAWFIESDKKSIKFAQLVTGSVRFKRIECKLKTESDINALINSVEQLDTGNTVLDVIASGMLDTDKITVLSSWQRTVAEKFLQFTLDIENLLPQIDQNYINQNYSQESASHRLLSALNGDSEALHAAHELITRFTKK